MKMKSILLAAAACFAAVPGFAADVIVTGKIAQNTTWTASNRYLLSGYVFVTPGATLTIEPGTIIQGRVSSGSSAAALVVSRGARINAAGTAQRPIIFTSELDQLNGNLTERDTGLWGGVVILGNASINSRANGAAAGTPAQDQVEGFSVTGDDVGLITFGGTDDADNSGTFRYVSIRHGGAVIGTANEINGLTLGGVGSGTTIEYVEVFANKDDGFEWFGGTVNAKYLVSAFNNDDAFDFDQGFRGNLQYLFAILGDIGSDFGDKGFEWDGATTPLTASPKAKTTVANATIIGASTAGKLSYALNIRDSAEALVFNSVFVNFEKMVDLENDVDDGPNPAPIFKNNIFFSQVAANNTALGLNARPTGTVDATALIGDATNSIVSPALRNIAYTATRALDPRPAAGSPALTGAGTFSGSGLTQTDFRGAFKDTNWAAGWTKLWNDGWFSLASAGTPDSPIVSGSASKLSNVSIRTTVAANAVVNPGFFINGTQAQTVLIRAVGPGLAQFGVTGVVADPTLELFSGATKIGENDNWSGAQASTLAAQVGAFPLTAASNDAVLVANLAPGAYTVQARGKTGGGDILIEIYEID